PQVMQGYWNRPDESEAALRDGWLRTGDLAVQDVDGYFRIVDRKKDVIIASGYNVYPREIEEVLLTCPGIRDAAAIGLPDPYRGETVKAVVVRDGPTSEADIIEFCKRELAAYKVPTEVEFLAELPKNLLGKVLRHQLRPVAGAPGS
ncbi:MAG: AMP-binding enzyme, partial [Chloroflexota bacterium]